jgi:hypothetical protein
MQHVATQNDLQKHRKSEGLATMPWTRNEVLTWAIVQEGLDYTGLVNKSSS